MGVLLGIDAGQTVIKAALFDLAGRELAVARGYTTVSSPHPRWQERDMDAAWAQAASAVHRALATARVDPGDVLAVGLCGHNDGIHLVDTAGRPVRPAILATDSRAFAEAASIRDRVGPRSLALTGQVPRSYSPVAVLRWLATHEPDTLARSRWAMFCKDWLRLRLTGEAATDATEASAFATDVHTQTWSDEVLALFGAEDMARLLPPILSSSAVAGTVTPAAAAETGLRPGTPVVAGAHDVDAAALGIGATEVGTLSLIMGTFSINQVVGAAPVADPRWQARTFLRPHQWLHMSTSPSSGSNLDWVVQRFGPWDGTGGPAYADAVAEAFDGADVADRDPLYLPFLYGSPHGEPHSDQVGGALAGLRGWHSRGDVLRSVLEGVAYNHRWHVRALGEAFPFGLGSAPARLCGGGANSPAWAQLLTDALALPVEVTDASEAGGRGAALLAGIGVGVYAGLAEASVAAVRVTRRHEPDPRRGELLAERYQRYLRVVGALRDAEAESTKGTEP